MTTHLLRFECTLQLDCLIEINNSRLNTNRINNWNRSVPPLAFSTTTPHNNVRWRRITKSRFKFRQEQGNFNEGTLPPNHAGKHHCHVIKKKVQVVGDNISKSLSTRKEKVKAYSTFSSLINIPNANENCLSKLKADIRVCERERASFCRLHHWGRVRAHYSLHGQRIIFGSSLHGELLRG